MENFSHRGKNVEFWQVTGVVIECQTRGETNGLPTGCMVVGHGNTPDIHSDPAAEHVIRIRTESGCENAIRLSGAVIPLRPGQAVTFISAGKNKIDGGWHSIVVNHSEGNHWLINNAQQLNYLLKLETPTFKSVLIAGLIGWVIGYQSGNWTIACGVAFTFLLFRVALKMKRISLLSWKLQLHLEQLIKLARDNYRYDSDGST